MAHGHDRSIIQSVRAGLILFIFLAGCSTTATQEGPVPYPIDTFEKHAKTNDETPFSSCNPSKYRVHGKNYYILKSATHYEAQGIASWYGKKFNKHRTSSGERYNLLAMTAAHKTLPIPTYVQVTNLKNNRKVIVKVNDRGPFAPNRLIDLSYVAAKKLGMIGHGTTYVKIKAIDPEVYYSSELASNKTKHALPNRRHFYIQVGAFKNKQYAKKIQNRLKPLLHSSIQVIALPKKSKNVYRVKIGPIEDVTTASHIEKKLRSIGLMSKRIKV